MKARQVRYKIEFGLLESKRVAQGIEKQVGGEPSSLFVRFACLRLPCLLLHRYYVTVCNLLTQAPIIAVWFDGIIIVYYYKLFSDVVLYLKKKLNASKPLNQSKGLSGNIGCRDKSIERVPQWSHMHRVNSIISGRSLPLHCTLSLLITTM